MVVGRRGRRPGFRCARNRVATGATISRSGHNDKHARSSDDRHERAAPGGASAGPGSGGVCGHGPRVTQMRDTLLLLSAGMILIAGCCFAVLTPLEDTIEEKPLPVLTCCH